MKKILVLIAFTFFGLWSYAQTTSMVWAENLKYSTTSGTSQPNDLVIDNAGNYYITGTFSNILDMDPGAGTYTLASVGNYDGFIAKYTTNGNLIWAKSFGTLNIEGGTSLYVINNLLYVSGSFGSATMDIDLGPATYTIAGVSGNTSGFVAMFDTSGAFQSAFSMPRCPISSIKVDNSGNIYIGGQFSGTVDLDPGPGTFSKTSIINGGIYTWDMFYGKYTASGTMLWANTKGGYLDDNANGISLDPATGNVGVAASYDNMYAALTNSSGTILKDANMGTGVISDVVFDSNSNLYFSGIYSSVVDLDWSATDTYSLPTNGSRPQAFVMKYNSSNSFTWAKQIIPILSINNATGPAINLDNNDDVLITNRESNASSASWFIFTKFDKNNGSIIWRNNLTSVCYNGNNGNDGRAIAYNPLDQTVLVTGVIGGSSVGSSTPCSFDADPGSGVYTLNGGVGNTSNRDVFMGKYGSCAGVPTSLSAISGSTMQCSGTTAIYSVSPVSGASSYAWSLPGGWTGVSTTNTISATASSSGTITVGASNACGSSTLQSLPVQVNPVPAQPLAISGATSFCNGAGIQTYSVPVVSGAGSYSWSLPGGWSGSSTSNTIQITPNATGGILSVSAINSCGNGPATNINITVNTLPSVSITGTSSVCSGSNVTLNANGANTYTWNTASNSNSISVSPSGNATYSVTGTDVNGCQNTATKNITVNALPAVAISGASSVCAGSSTSLTASGANTYTWNTASNSNSISVSPSGNTTYSITGTDVNGCQNTATKNITVNVLPTVAITGTGSTCAGSSISLTASGANTYTWSTSSNSNSISVSPSGNTTYTVTGTDANGCQNTATKNITVDALPAVSINGANAVCAGSSISLTASGANTYTWNTGSSNTSISEFPPADASYTVTGTDINGCINTATHSVTVNTLPSVTIGGNTTVCMGSATTLTATGATSYTWNTSATGNTVSVAPTSNTNYSVTGTDANGCTGSAFTNITVNTLPSVSINGASVVCSGNSINLTATGASSYTWSTNSNSSSISVSPTTNTTYSVTGADGTGCENTAIASITVNALPPVTISATQTLICVGESATLTASGADTYTWSTGATSISETVSPTSNSTYTLSGTDVNGCSQDAVTTISVSLCTGIESLNNDAPSILLYPNPAGNELNISCTDVMRHIEITDVTGKTVYAIAGLDAVNASIDMKNYSKGMYVVTIHTYKQIKNIKLVKE